MLQLATLIKCVVELKAKREEKNEKNEEGRLSLIGLSHYGIILE